MGNDDEERMGAMAGRAASRVRPLFRGGAAAARRHTHRARAVAVSEPPGAVASRASLAMTNRAESMNGIAMRRTKAMSSECLIVTCPSAAPTRKSRPWASIAVALVAVVSVLAGELWAAREAPVLDGAAHQVATE